MPITQTVTITDLISAYDTELQELEEAYNETKAFIQDEWGEDALDRPIPDTNHLEDESIEHLAALRATASAYEESGKQIQKRNHALETLANELEGEVFELRMLTGQELMDIERDLKLKARSEDVDDAVVEHYRKGLVVDAATVNAPEGIPLDESDSPVPSEAGNPLTLALYEAVESLNQAGSVGFRAPGFDDTDLQVGAGSSEPRTPSSRVSERSDTRGTTQEASKQSSGDS